MKEKQENFRVPGEFEKQESVLMMWPLSSYATSTNEFDRDAVALDIVKNLIDHVHVIVSCYDEGLKKHAMNKLVEGDVDLSKVEFIIYPCEIIYPRDFGAEVLIGSYGNRKFVDFGSNAYGMCSQGDPLSRNLEAFDKIHAKYLGIENVSFTRLVSEGGDHEFNGKGIMMTIEDTEVNKRNPGWSKEEVESEFKKLFHLEKIIWIPRSTFDDEHMYLGAIPDENNELKAYRAASANGHIDEMCRFISEDTILLADISEEEARKSELHRMNKERLDEAFKVLSAQTNTDGKSFKIIRIPAPDPIYVEIKPGDDVYEVFTSYEIMYNGKMLDGSVFPTGTIKVLPALSYCNFLIANNIVLAQKYYREGMSLKIKEKDEIALNILKKAFPNKNVIAVDSIALNLYGGGIHCNTRNVPEAIKDRKTDRSNP